MTEFKAGDKVRINEGLLEGQSGVVVGSDDHLTSVALEDVAFGGGPLVFFTQTLVSADEDHEALTVVKLYPDLTNSEHYIFRLTTWVGGIMYQSLPMDGKTVKRALSTPPAGLYAVESKLKKDDTPKGVSWKTLWQES